MKVIINISSIERNSNKIFETIRKYYAELMILIIIIVLLYVGIYKENYKEHDTIEGFSKISDFRNRRRNKNNNNTVEGSRYDKMINSMKLLDDNSEGNSETFLGELFTNISPDDDNDSNKKIKYNKNGSKASMKNVKNNIIEYYNHFDQDKFSKKTNSTLESLRKFKHFKEEFWNIFEY